MLENNLLFPSPDGDIGFKLEIEPGTALKTFVKFPSPDGDIGFTLVYRQNKIHVVP